MTEGVIYLFRLQGGEVTNGALDITKEVEGYLNVLTGGISKKDRKSVGG